MALELGPEEFEQLRRKNLEDLQEAAAKSRSETAWRKIFRERSPHDEDPGSWSGFVGREFQWVPVEPYETIVTMAERIERGCGQAARHLTCDLCASQAHVAGEPVDPALKWAGFDSKGRQVWLHTIQVADDPPEPSWADRFRNWVADWLEFERTEPEITTHPEEVICKASAIIQQFRLIEVPPIPGSGINMGAYPDPAKPYNDPSAPGTAKEMPGAGPNPAGSKE
jgi:hypothetical protein